MTAIDFGKTASDYGKHRQGFPDQLFERLGGLGLPGRGQRARVVDLGTGTGTLARGLARRGCEVTGVDIAQALLDQGAELDRAAGVSIRHHLAPAESTGLPSGAYDAVTAGQCWHWFDRPKAASEAMRLLAPGGLLVIAHLDWLSLPGNVVEATERLIEAYHPGYPAPDVRFGQGVGLYGQWLRDAYGAGFERLETFSFDLAQRYTPEGWRGRVRASAPIGASLPPDQIERFDSELEGLLRSGFPGEAIDIPHRVFALVARSPEAT